MQCTITSNDKIILGVKLNKDGPYVKMTYLKVIVGDNTEKTLNHVHFLPSSKSYHEK